MNSSANSSAYDDTFALLAGVGVACTLLAALCVPAVANPITIVADDGPVRGLTLGPDGNIYGSNTSGAYGDGSIFKIVPGQVPVDIFDFNGRNDEGTMPFGPLAVVSDGSIVGFDSQPDGDTTTPILFALNPSTGTTTDFSFGAGNEADPFLVPAPRGALFFGSFDGSSTGAPGYGYFARLDGTQTSVIYVDQFTKNSQFDDEPVYAMIYGLDGNLYGIASYDDPDGFATQQFFEFQPAYPETTMLYEFPNTEGEDAPVALAQATDGSFYCVEETTGVDDFGLGELIHLLLVNGQYVGIVEHTFTGKDGAYPVQLLVGSDGYVYGTCHSGGDGYSSSSAGYGTLYQFKPNGSKGGNFTLLHSFTGPSGDGESPMYLVETAGHVLYGETLGKIYSLPLPIDLIVQSASSSQDGTETTVEFTLHNNSTVKAHDVSITGAKLADNESTSAFPLKLGDIAAGSSVTAYLSFPPNLYGNAKRRQLDLNGEYQGTADKFNDFYGVPSPPKN